LDKYAWYDDNSKGSIHEVGQKEPNDWKLFDMHGNIWEWCEDWYNENKKYKVVRGGSWDGFAISTRSAVRDGRTPTSSYISRGFRLIRTLP
jgi:formylglycine-generating enzyme required for sulfatase activity